jgi:uncharacterized phage protein (TIGR01671 family)
MSKLKFRVWDLQEKRFYYSDKGYQGHYVLSLDGKFTDLQTGVGGNEVVVQQHIGLKDKEGREIYEGDIVSFNDVLHSQLPVMGIAEVIFTADLSLVDAPCYGLWFKSGFHKNMLGEILVLGNIFESPHLADAEEKLPPKRQAPAITDAGKIVPLGQTDPESPTSKELQKIFHEIEKMEAERIAWKQMFDMQTNIVMSLELDKMRLEKELDTLKNENRTLQGYLDNIHNNLKGALKES